MKKNGFIATSILYAFFLVFITLFIGLVTAYAHNKASVLRINEKVKEELKGIRNRTLVDVEIGDTIKFSINPDQKEYINEEGTWMLATKNVDDSGHVTLVFVSDREAAKREYYKVYNQETGHDDFTPYHRGIEGMEKAIAYDVYTANNGTPTHINEAITVSKASGTATTVKIDFFTLDTLLAIKNLDVPQYIKDNLINVGSDYVIKNDRDDDNQISINGTTEVPAVNVYKQSFLTPSEYPNNWVRINPQGTVRHDKIKTAIDNGEVTRNGYYRLRFYNFGANLDANILKNNTKYAKAARLYLGKNKGKNTYIFDTDAEAAKKAALEQFYADYCGAYSYEDYELNKNLYPLSYVSNTYDPERGTEYIDWCYNANTYPYEHLQSENVIAYEADYRRNNIDIVSETSDYIIDLNKSNQSTYTEQNIRLQMTITIIPDKTDADGHHYYHDYILAGNGTPDNMFIYTNGVKS